MSLIAGDRNLTDYPSGAKDKGYAVIIEDEKKVLNIFRYHEEKWSGLNRIASLTEEPVYSCLEYSDYPSVKDILFSYIRETMKNNTGLEIWYNWSYENVGLEKKTRNITELTEEDLDWVLGDEYFKSPKCLKIFKYTRGKK